MPEPDRPARWWDPTWQRLLVGSFALFLAILAFMLGRIEAGADPGLKPAAKATTTQTAPQTQSQEGDGEGDGQGYDDDSPGYDDGGQGFDDGGAQPSPHSESQPPADDPPTSQAS